MRVPKSMQCYQVFACMTAMLLDYRLDSARHVDSSIIYSATLVSKCSPGDARYTCYRYPIYLFGILLYLKQVGHLQYRAFLLLK